MLLLLVIAEHAHKPSRTFSLGASSTTGHILGADPLKDDLGVQLHYYPLVYQLVNNQNDTRHVIDQTLSLDIVLEHLIEAVMDCVEDGGQDQLIVILAISEDVNCHVCIAPEDCHVVIHIHDVVLVHVQLCCSLLLVRLSEKLSLELLLLGVRLQPHVQFLVVVLRDDSSTFVVKHDHAFDVAYHVSAQHVFFMAYLFC